MTKSIPQLAEEYDSIEIEEVNFTCHNCGEKETEVYLYEQGYRRSWPCCFYCNSRVNHVLSGLDQRGIDIT